MRIRWRPREYERTCLDCGGVWKAQRAIARPHMRILPRNRLGGGGVLSSSAEVIAANAALGEQAAALRQCPHCGSTRYRQHLLWS